MNQEQREALEMKAGKATREDPELRVSRVPRVYQVTQPDLETKGSPEILVSGDSLVAEERKARQVLLERKEFLASLVLLEDQDVLEIPEPEVLVAKGE